jgi:hypothetical protein
MQADDILLFMKGCWQKVQEYLSTTAIDHSTPQQQVTTSPLDSNNYTNCCLHETSVEPQHGKHNLVKTFKLQSNLQDAGFSDFTDNFNNKEPFGAMC